MNQNEFRLLHNFVDRTKGKKPNQSTVSAALTFLQTGAKIERGAESLAKRILAAKETLNAAKPGVDGTIELYFSMHNRTSAEVKSAVVDAIKKEIPCSRAAIENKCNSMPVYSAVKSINVLHRIRADWEAFNG